MKGAKNVSLLKYQIVNNNISDVTVNGEMYAVAFSGVAIETLKNLTADLYLNGTLVESKNVSVTTIGSGMGTGTLSFNKTFNVVKSGNATIEIKAQELPQLVNADYITVARTSGNNASDLNGKVVTINGSTVAGNRITIANASLTVAVDSADVADLLAAGSAAQDLGKIRITAKNDDLSLREIKIPLVVGTGTLASATRLIQSPTLVDAAGNTIANGTVNTSNNTIEFTTFTNGGFTVARNTDAPLTVKANISTMAASEVNTTVGLDLGGVNFYLKAQGSVDEVSTLLPLTVTAAGLTAKDLISGGKLVVAANGVQDAGQGYVKYTVTNNGAESVKLSDLTV